MIFLRLLLLSVSLFLTTSTSSETIYVVVNENNTQFIDAAAVKSIYNDEVSHWKNGNEILVFELPVKSFAREKFTQNLLNKSAISSQRDWSNRFVNNTLKNDVKVKPQRLVARFVGIKETAIGYVPESEMDNLSGLKVIMTIE